ncbi:DHA2 family efflux MFS transporter permease subunit [Williamsia sp. CHRR-6]|uniref:DHA2 family efflux MFS transporter permease subunit n=1 Tax=Williamsia sp. CHRR-6 TaxID=2835871 RepID=UPI001BD9B166|nr:DHA2 family efflux MFS transporter permease subunit [Williamsia sp. CHRR-6]MBT0566691.1 DHA2 family efflux MFS transporter permease subunit [Williamsia sp. CHRR-6]
MSTQSASAASPITRFRGPAMAVLTFAMFMDLLDVTIVNVALPAIRSDLNASASQLEWVVGGYVLAFATVLITAGRLGDRYGRQRVFITGITGFTIASLSASLAQSGDMLVYSRVAQGLFAGLMVPQVLASVQALYKPRERAPIFAIIGVVTALAAVIGPVLGGWLVTSNPIGGQWRAIFYLNIPIGIVIVIAAVILVPNTRAARPSPLDPLGVVLAAGGILLIVYPLVEGRQLGWPWWSFVMMAASPVVLALFIVNERRHSHSDDIAADSAMMPLRLFTHRGFAGGVAVQFLFQGSINAFFLILALYVQTGLNFSAIASGALTLPFSLGAMTAAGLAVRLVSRLGRLLPLIGATLITIGTAATIYVLHSTGRDYSAWDTVIPMAIAGFGLTMTVVPLYDIALAAVDERDSGAASGVFGTFQQVGGALGVAIVGVLFFGAAGRYTQPELVHALAVASAVPIVGYALAAACSMLLPSISAVRAHLAAVEAATDDDLDDTTVPAQA